MVSVAQGQRDAIFVDQPPANGEKSALACLIADLHIHRRLACCFGAFLRASFAAAQFCIPQKLHRGNAFEQWRLVTDGVRWIVPQKSH
jgi:hypothetical protein